MENTTDILPENARCFLESLDRCLTRSGFFTVFYSRFIGSSEEVQRKFTGTDFEAQNRMLERSLRLAAVAVGGGQAGMEELQKRAISHDQCHYGIEPHLYELWLNAIVETAAEFDDEWSHSLEMSWRSTLDKVVEIVSSGYECQRQRA